MWERWERIDVTSDVFPLAYTIARNLATDRAREAGRVELRPDLENGLADDPSDVAAARIELKQVLRGLMTLTPRYRDLLLAEAGWSSPNPEATGVATNMARMRARRRLRAILERASVLIGLPFKRIRAGASRLSASERVQSGQSVVTFTVEVAVACLLALTGAASIVDGGANGTPGEMRTRSLGQTVASRGSSGRPPGHQGTLSSVEAARSHRLARTSVGEVESEAAPNSPLDALPKGEGEGREGGSFGSWGYHEEGDTTMDVAGEEIRLRHRHDYRNPRCVRRAIEGEVSTDCSGGRAPNGYVEAEHEGESTRVDYGD